LAVAYFDEVTMLTSLKPKLSWCLWALIIAQAISAHAWGQDAQPQPQSDAEARAKAAEFQQTLATADLQTLIELARNIEPLMAQGNFEQAAGIYGVLNQRLEQAVQTGEYTDIRAAYLLSAALLTAQGRAFAALQEDRAAEKAFLAAMEKIPDFPAALIARGEMNLERDLPAQALPDFQKAVEAERNSLPAQFGFGKSLVMVASLPGGDPRLFEPAIRPLTRVIDNGESPYLAEAYRHRGSAYGGLYKFDKAVPDIQKSLELDPAPYETHFAAAVIELRQENYAAAVEKLTKAIELYKPLKGREDSVYSTAPLLKASALLEVGKKAPDEASKNAAYQASAEEAQRLLDKFPGDSPYTAGDRARALVARGIAERMLGKMGTAIQTLSYAIELDPSLGEAYFRRGICLQEIGENRMALADFTQAAAIRYTDPRGNLWEGFVYAKLGDYHEAIRAYGDAIAASDRYTPAFVNRGLAYMMLGDHEKAISDFNDALRIEPTNGDYYFKRGVAHVQLGELDKAAESLASAIEFAPTHREAYRHMADVLQRQGRSELAEEYRKKGAALDGPQQPAK
jgi:tetratricopeptide (TPR) repeat protein